MYLESEIEVFVQVKVEKSPFMQKDKLMKGTRILKQEGLDTWKTCYLREMKDTLPNENVVARLPKKGTSRPVLASTADSSVKTRSTYKLHC